MEWIIQLPILLFSVVVHEFSHGLAAYKRGDDTAERAGRLTLNPMDHLDPFGTVFIPLLCFFTRLPMFGWAKPVPVNPRRLREPVRDMVGVALMGPLSNIVLAMSSALLFKLVTVFDVFTPAYRETVLQALLFGVTVNLFLAFFNLLPLHPLDGSRVVGGLLPAKYQSLYRRHMPYGMFIILVLLFTQRLVPMVLWPMEKTISLLVGLGILG